MSLYRVIRSKKTAMWFNGFVYVHRGTEPRGQRAVDWSTSQAQIIDINELAYIEDAILATEGPIGFEILKVESSNG